MSASSQQTAPVTLHTKVDVTALVATRARYKAAGAKVVPAYTDLIAKCVAKGLCQYPLLAGRWVDDCIEYPGEDCIHIGIAVDTEDGLLVPILRDVARRPLLELSAEFRSLIERGRRGQLKANDMQGAVFTITSLGSFGIDAFTPIINLPESAILGVGAIRKELVVLENGSFAARDMLTLSLTFDHRVIDGAPAARFLQAVTEAMQFPPE
jgi:pyruvate dehydrogenase E2 component (dihydrolipoamide acetyltransferase)